MSEKTSEYLLLFRSSEWSEGLSLEQLQEAMDRYIAWMDGLKEQGKILAARPLEREGRFISAKRGRPVADGPFAESKEAVGGYIVLQVDSLEEAAAIARECPVLENGGSIEVRPLAED